ncbi:MAG: transglycosylase SLT domain-containing protein [Candidatus Tyrphobacter sp.]
MNSITASTLSQHGVAYASQIAVAARDHGLDPNLLAAVAAQETGGPGASAGRNVVGDGGHGRGLFQIDDRYHAFARGAQAMDPAANAQYAAGMLSGLIARYGSVHRALSAYNAGDPDARGTVTQWGDGSRLGYADSVLRHEALIAGGPVHDAPAPGATPVQPPAAAPPQPTIAALPIPPPAHRHTYRELIAGDRDAAQFTSDET